MCSQSNLFSCCTHLSRTALVCALAALALLGSLGCMSDMSRNAFQGAFNDVSSGVHTSFASQNANDRNTYGNYVP
jgi:hypothetical protein